MENKNAWIGGRREGGRREKKMKEEGGEKKEWLVIDKSIGGKTIQNKTTRMKGIQSSDVTMQAMPESWR